MHIRIIMDLLNKAQIVSFWLFNQDIVTLEEIIRNISPTHYKNWQLVNKQTKDVNTRMESIFL